MMSANGKPDRVNAILAGLVFLGSFIVYSLTVQQSLSFWDCGEFIACSANLGIPHPPGVPLYILLGRVFAMIPFVEDISHRINYISVLSSSVTAAFAYLLTARLVRQFATGDPEAQGPETESLNRKISYIGGLVGGFMVAFSLTNWANSVEAEVYGLSLASMLIIAWLTVRYYEMRTSDQAGRLMILAFFMAFLGVGMHLTVILIFPFFAIFFALKPDAGRREYLAICVFVIVELLLIILFSNDRGGTPAFFGASVILALILLGYLRKVIRWGIAIAIGTVSTIMLGFELFIWVAPSGFILLAVLGYLSQKYGWRLQWKIALTILFVCIIGFSVHLFLPIRSAEQPRINENNPSRSFQAFVDFLERKQYGQQSMIDRMFQRRGSWTHQFGRHPHMGFWSYFEEQYSDPGWQFVTLLMIGLLGMYVAVRKRLELGLPFMTLFLICSVGLILYMNFADGTAYNARTGDAYLEVRERDYFFTPAFVFFGIAIGMGVSALIEVLRSNLAVGQPAKQKMFVYAFSILILLPVIPLTSNYNQNDRSNNIMPLVYGKNLLDTCEKDAILFTTGDNETFTLWCLQEAYGYRTDVRVVNQALLNGDWYIQQMKDIYNVPMSLTDEQILVYPYERSDGQIGKRPKETFNDRARGVRTYLAGYRHENGVVTVPQMVVDDIIIENGWRYPIYFSSLPYATSPLNLHKHLRAVGVINKLVQDEPDSIVDFESSYNLFMNVYQFTGFEDPDIYRSAGVTRDFMMTFGNAAVRTIEEAFRRGEEEKAVALMEKTIAAYPEHWQVYLMLANYHNQRGDSAAGDELMYRMRDTLAVYAENLDDNRYYRQNHGMAVYEIGKRTGNQQTIDEGIRLATEGFLMMPNDAYQFRKLAMMLSEQGKMSELMQAAQIIGTYPRTRQDPVVNRVLGMGGRSGNP